MKYNLKLYVSEFTKEEHGGLKERIADLQRGRGSLIDSIKEHQESQGRITYTCDIPCPNYKDWLQ